VNADEKNISLRSQCVLLGLSRSSLYYRPVPISPEEQKLMNRLDEIFTEWPFFGSRRLQAVLNAEGYEVGREHVQTLMKRLGLEAIYPKPSLSLRNEAHKIYPYLLLEVEIVRPFQVWSCDITYVRMAQGFMYLVAVIDWYSRFVLSWRLSNSLETDFCVEALTEALERGHPEIFNTDQGCQFTSQVFTQVLLSRGIKISMDGKRRALDNVFVERLWRSVKYENIYLKAYETVRNLEEGLVEYFEFYNTERPHQSLEYRTPEEVHYGKKALKKYA